MDALLKELEDMGCKVDRGWLEREKKKENNN